MNNENLKTWKCTVCGKSFNGEYPPIPCPVCGVGEEYFIEIKKEKIKNSSTLQEKIIIVGNNAAGVSAAEAIRERNKNAFIQIISNEKVFGYYRPSLSKFLSTNLSDDEFYLKSKDWYQENNITITLNTNVNKILKDQKKILLDNGDVEEYDKLILANGSRCFMPPIKGYEKEGVFTLRNLEDANHIKNYAKNSKVAVVVGGGILGIETAWQLHLLGVHVTIIERSDRLLLRQLDERGSTLLEKAIQAQNIRIIKDSLVEEILGDKNITGIKTNRGENILCDLVIVSAGICPNKEIADEAGIDTNRGVVVNEKMQTNEIDIYACGDVAEFEKINYGLWTEAIEQGKVAGANVVGDSLIYKNITPSNVFECMNIQIFSIGDIGRDTDKNYETSEIYNSEKKNYQKMYFENNRLVGAILFGDVSKSVKITEGVRKHFSLSMMIKNLY
ncbi:FAD-dependent oxidoreductase [Anaerophilus nitritogenes]|uniref:FAD-dependent oxidoreductase n=1 Tax=Anaerophilus nitritogenes TaxID=2498136 RepID=UPI0013EC857B|nr:FAD-dependent oxidoreductase [Anaerophilus nitritogenes]